MTDIPPIEDHRTPFERLTDFTRKIVRVSKKEIGRRKKSVIRPKAKTQGADRAPA